MKHQLKALIAFAACAPLSALAAPTLYGKANVSYQSVSNETDFVDAASADTDESFTELSSNASRIGIKGEEEISEGLKAIYKAEFQVDYDDGDRGDERVFSQRNIYVGLKGNWGSVVAGKFDTPFKKAQKKIDLFNDLEGDIKNIITVNDNRSSNSVMYVSPSWGGAKLFVDLVTREEDDADNGTSLALTYERSGFYGALAYDNNVEAEETSATRLVLQYKVAGFQLGVLGEEFEGVDGEKESGAVFSVKYSIDNWALKLQAGESDIKRTDGSVFNIGADYKLSKKAKIFGYYTANGYTVDKDAATEADVSEDYLGLGIEVKF